MGRHVYKTKDRRDIEFRIKPFDTDRAPREPWIMHRLDAYVDGEHAGYLKITYVPRDVFERVLPTVWHYLSIVSGHVMDPDDLDDVWRSMALKHAWHRHSERPEPAVRDADLANWAERYIPRFEEFEAFHVDKPLVDYIHVEPEFRRQGIATALYKKGARWLAKRFRLPLYASGLQQPGAEKAWEKMRKLKRIPTHEEPRPGDPKRTRIRIDYRKAAGRVADRYLKRK